MWSSVTTGAVDNPSASTAAYRRIKRAIVTASIAPGTPLVEAALMEQFGVGRTPLREALHRLESDGLVVIFPRRGVLVAQLGLREIQHMFEARIAFEAETARLAAERITDKERRTLIDIHHDLRATEARQSFGTFLQADQRLHLELVRLAQNIYLSDAAHRILTLNEWLWHVHQQQHGISPTDFASHEAIVEAVLQGDAVAARHHMINHIECSRALLRVAF
jgi:DNA-binding GntR family transcriptional regulator